MTDYAAIVILVTLICTLTTSGWWCLLTATHYHGQRRDVTAAVLASAGILALTIAIKLI